MRRVATAVAVTIALVACGGSGDGSGSATTAAPTTGAAPSSSATTPATTEPVPDLAALDLELTEIATTEAATALAVRSGEAALYVAEQEGRVRRIKVTDDGKGHVRYDLERTPVLDIHGDVTAGGEQGLLGLAFSPDGRRMYVAYTTSDADTQRVDEFRMNDTRVDTKSRRQIFEVPDFAPNHNGGDLIFGPDGFLYYSMGDGGGGGDPQDTGQDPSDLLGDLLRVDPEGGDPYGVPDGNPFKDGGGAPEVYAFGLRNPWRFSFDRDTGDLWIGDVGQGQYEEIDFLPASDGAGNGANLGWSAREGVHAYEGGDRPAGAIDPIFEYNHSEGCAVIGGYVYRGKAIPALQGVYLFSDSCHGEVRALVQQHGAVVAERTFDVAASSPSSFGEDADGELYVVSLEGTVYRIDAG